MIHYYFVAHAPRPRRSNPPKCISLRAWFLASWAKVYIWSLPGLFVHAFLFCIDSSCFPFASVDTRYLVCFVLFQSWALVTVLRQRDLSSIALTGVELNL